MCEYVKREENEEDERDRDTDSKFSAFRETVVIRRQGVVRGAASGRLYGHDARYHDRCKKLV